ncbi:CBS domain-containing protein [Pseudonocardia sp. T1-2H]|uniref:CBS domain-containing protein n=1 Tax=Pseudonocardia sp. T1-2H TaxID=3128899 RepID=UPI003100FB06
MKADDVMSQPVITVRPMTPVPEAAALLASHGFTAAPVVDDQGRLIGIVTEADLVRHQIRPEGWPARSGGNTVGEVMTGSPLALRPVDDLADVVSLMLDARVRSIPIVEDDGELVGIVSRRDVLRVVARREQTSAEVRSRRGLAPDPATEETSARVGASGRIVVGFDGSPAARVAVRDTLLEASRRGASVSVVAAFSPPAVWPVVYGLPAVPTLAGLAGEIEGEVRRTVIKILDTVRSELAGGTPHVEVVAVQGSPGEVLVDRSSGADLLVVGSRGRGPGASLLLGSVGLHCALHARCSVTIVRPESEPVEAHDAAAAAGVLRPAVASP